MKQTVKALAASGIYNSQWKKVNKALFKRWLFQHLAELSKDFFLQLLLLKISIPPKSKSNYLSACQTLENILSSVFLIYICLWVFQQHPPTHCVLGSYQYCPLHAKRSQIGEKKGKEGKNLLIFSDLGVNCLNIWRWAQFISVLEGFCSWNVIHIQPFAALYVSW